MYFIVVDVGTFGIDDVGTFCIEILNYLIRRLFDAFFGPKWFSQILTLSFAFCLKEKYLLEKISILIQGKCYRTECNIKIMYEF